MRRTGDTHLGPAGQHGIDMLAREIQPLADDINAPVAAQAQLLGQQIAGELGLLVPEKAYADFSHVGLRERPGRDARPGCVYSQAIARYSAGAASTKRLVKAASRSMPPSMRPAPSRMACAVS